jgi:hypothetical protein
VCIPWTQDERRVVEALLDRHVRFILIVAEPQVSSARTLSSMPIGWFRRISQLEWLMRLPLSGDAEVVRSRSGSHSLGEMRNVSGAPGGKQRTGTSEGALQARPEGA